MEDLLDPLPTIRRSHEVISPLSYPESLMQQDPSVTALLRAWHEGDAEALHELMPLVYDELRRLAQHHVSRERPGQTLTATALVHEAFLRLVGAEATFKDRSHFLAVAARLMRRILIDRSRAKARIKRGGGLTPVQIEELELAAETPSSELQALDDALEELATFDSRKAQAVDLVFFGGLTYDEAAEALSISRATLHRDLGLAKAWLHLKVAEA